MKKRHPHAPKGREIDLGLAVAGALLLPGQCRELMEIAAYCGCSKQLIHTIEKQAITKIRQAIAKNTEESN